MSEQQNLTVEPAAAGAPAPAPVKPRLKKKTKKWIRRIIALALVAALGAGGYWKFRGGSQAETEVIRDTVQYGAITALVRGSGIIKAKNNESIAITTAGTVMEVYITEGEQVTAGTPLFSIDSEAARNAVKQAEKELSGYEKQLSALNKDIAGLNLAPSYPGKLLEVVDLNPGDTISRGQRVATVADDTRLRLTQYYSYAYEGQLRAGQTVDVSVPALMSSLTGTVEKVHMVSRITPEGSRLFSADILINNPGTLTAGMAASATAMAGGETIYPYETGELEYFRVGELTSTVNGTVLSCENLVDYQSVTAGQVLVRIDGEDSQNELFTLEQNLERAQKALEDAQENLANCNAVAPIDGTVIGLAIQPGDEINAGTSVVTISDLTTLTVTATVDERNVSYVKPGMAVDLDQWGNTGAGFVENVSFSSSINNGVATYPLTIGMDNYDGVFQVNSNVQYSLVASQNDNCLILPIQCVRNAALEDGTAINVVYVEGERPDNALENVMVNEEIPDGFWPVQVEIGISDNYNVEIRSGVEEGTVVYTQMMTTEAWG